MPYDGLKPFLTESGDSRSRDFLPSKKVNGDQLSLLTFPRNAIASTGFRLSRNGFGQSFQQLEEASGDT